MTGSSRIGLLDADVLIAAHRDYYAPDFCRGFWDCINHHIGNGRLLIIDRVLSEITSPPDLVQWVGRVDLVSTSGTDVAEAYTEVVDWVQNNPRFNAAAKAEFASKADGWLVAYSMVNDTIVVTNEVYNPNIRRSVKIPNICREFGVDYQNTYSMLRDLNAQFEWENS